MTAYDTSVLAASPDGYWKLDEASGNTFADSSPGNHPLVAGGAFVENYQIPGPSTLNIPYAADFNGTNNAPICATTTVGSYAIGQPFTVEGWYAGVGALSSYHCIVEKGDFNTAVTPWYSLSINPSGVPIFWFRNVASVDYQLLGPGAVNDASYSQRGPWHHIAGTYNPTAALAKLYVDGLKVRELSVPNTGWGTGAQGIATGAFAANYSGGWTACVAVYPTLFTDAGVLAHFTEGIQGNAFYVSQLQSQLGAYQTILDAIYAAVHHDY